MTRHRSIVVDPDSEGQRLDVFLAHSCPDLSRSSLKRLIEQERVLVQGRSVRAAHRVRAGERIDLDEPPPTPAEPQPEQIALVVLFEDSDLVVLDKAPGLVVHPAPGNPDGTLVNALLHHCSDLSGVGGVARPGIVHRLDRNTSGVMVVAKSDLAHRRLSEQFLQHSVHKEYLAFAARRAGAKALSGQGCFDTWYGRHPVHRKRFSSKVDKGKRAVTRYQVLARYRTAHWEVVKVRLLLETGRTHQIRVHLTDAGYPLLGDKLYGGRSLREFPFDQVPNRQALHAHRLGFRHPRTDEALMFEAPLPSDLVALEQGLVQACDDNSECFKA